MRITILTILLLLGCCGYGQQHIMEIYNVAAASSSTSEDIHYLFENDTTDESGSDFGFTNTSMTFVASPTPPQGSYWVNSGSATTTYGTLPTSYTDNFPDDLSISFIFRTGSSTGTNEILVNTGTEKTTGLTIRFSPGGNDLDVFTNTTEISANGGGTGEDVDHYFVVTYNSTSGYVNIYRDNVQTVTNGAGTTGITLTGNWYIMGNGSGQIDDFRVFPRVITSAEVTKIYNNPGTPLDDI